MPFGIDFPQLRRPNVATPPFVPQGAVPALPSPGDEEDLVPSSAASRELQDLISARRQEQLDHPVSMKRQILGGIVGGWAPGIGRAISDPGGQRFQQQAELLKQKAQLEDAALDRRYKIENINSSIANRQESRRLQREKQDAAIEARNQTDMTNRDKMGQIVGSPEFLKFEDAPLPVTALTQPRQYGPPSAQVAAMQSPEGVDYRSVAALPLRSEFGSGPHKEMTAVVRPDGSYQVPSTAYDPEGTARFQKTPGQLAKEKWEATTTETPADILEAFPDSAKRMTENAILGFRNALIRKDTAAAAALAAKERANENNALKLEMQENTNNLRRELAGNAANLQRELAANKAAGGGRPTTGAERQALAYFNRGKSAIEDLEKVEDGQTESLEDRIAKAGALTQAGLRLPSMLQSADQQRYTQAQRAFTEARLRKESGAAIPEHELENDAKTYFAQPNDDPKTKEQKRAARQAVLDGLAFSSGKAFEEFFGEPFQTPALKARGANAPTPMASPQGQAPPANLLKEGVATTFGNGQVWTLQGGKPKQVK
jgi:hypothetical protein